MTNAVSLLPEWSPQAAVLLAWPHQNTDWRPWLNAIENDYIQLTCAISKAVSPLILCQDEHHQRHIQASLKSKTTHTPDYIIVPYNDTWCRDYGPLTLGNNTQHQLLNFRFNGWGDKYDATLDNQINQHLKSRWQVPLTTIEFELEGGSIETDGTGTLLTTHHCLLGSNRNTQCSKQDIEKRILNTLGLQRILWLNEGALIGDDTDSHIDNLARFCNPNTIAYIACDDKNDPHYQPLTAMKQELQQFRQKDGSPYRLQSLPLPSPQYNEDGQRLPASYINFLIVNQHVIVPVFNCPEDSKAVQSLLLCFPEKTIITVPGNNLIRQFGGPHCATMQLPVGVI